MAETFRQYIKIRTFLGYRPKEILLELQNAFGNDAPTYASVQRWSKRFREAVDSPLGSPLSSQVNVQIQEDQLNNDENQINSNAKKSESKSSTNGTNKSKRSRAIRSKSQRFINE